MAKKIRVYELARELGLTNKEGLELALSMGIGVTSHSSSIEEAQADRVRRRAERDGLKRTHPPDETAPAPGPETVAAQAPAAVAPAGRAGTGDAAQPHQSHQVGRSTSSPALAPPPGVVSPGAEPPLHDRQPAHTQPAHTQPAHTQTGSHAAGSHANRSRRAGPWLARARLHTHYRNQRPVSS